MNSDEFSAFNLQFSVGDVVVKPPHLIHWHFLYMQLYNLARRDRRATLVCSLNKDRHKTSNHMFSPQLAHYCVAAECLLLPATNHRDRSSGGTKGFSRVHNEIFYTLHTAFRWPCTSLYATLLLTTNASNEYMEILVWFLTALPPPWSLCRSDWNLKLKIVPLFLGFL